MRSLPFRVDDPLSLLLAPTDDRVLTGGAEFSS